MAPLFVDPNPGPVSNWNHSVASQPAVIVRAKTPEDVCAAVRDRQRFPSPVSAVGSAHTVTGALRNEGGTVVDVSALDEILGFGEVAGQEVVRVQGGVKLAKLHRWLDAQGKEISFSPEIGDATVGSIVGSTSKDSSLDGPGSFAALVAAVTFVDEAGALRSASLADDGNPQLLRQITSAYGLMGIIVEASLLVRTHSVCNTMMTYHPCLRAAPVAGAGSSSGSGAVGGGAAAAAIVCRARAECDNIFAIMHPGRDQIYIEQRWLVKDTTRVVPGLADVKLFLVGTPKSYCFKRGRPLHPALAAIMSLNRHLRLQVRHRRYRFTNSYTPVTASQDRLDFSYFEFDLSRLEEVVQGSWDLAARYERRTGFMPGGFAIYFVRRPGNKLAGSYTGAAGTSFMLDPIHNDPNSREWHRFNEAYARWAVALGANVSLSQTKGLPPGPGLGGALPSSIARERFLTPFFRQFVVSDAQFKSQVSYARPAGDEHPRRDALLAEVEQIVAEAEADAGAAAVAAARQRARDGSAAGLLARASRLLSRWRMLTMEKGYRDDLGSPLALSPKKSDAAALAPLVVPAKKEL